MKRYLFVLPNNSIGGAEQYLRMLVDYYQEDEIDIYFMRRNKRKGWNLLEKISDQYYMSAYHEYLGMIRFFFLFLFRRKKEYHCVFTSHVYSNSLVGFMRKIGVIKTKKHIARESTSIFLRFKGLQLWLYKMAYTLGYYKIDLLICQTELMKSQLEEHFPKITNRIKTHVVPNPVDLEKMKTLSREEAELKIEAPYIVSAGRLIHLKGYDLLIRAFSELKANYPNLKLLIMGKGELRNDLIQLAEELDVANDLILPGHLGNIYPMLKNASACVISSRIEGFPNVLLQMMAMNTNVVATRCAGGIDEIPGVLNCETNDYKALKKQVETVLSTNTSNNREIFDNYLEERNLDNFVKTIESLSDGNQ